jgi:hypothetical protein
MLFAVAVAVAPVAEEILFPALHLLMILVKTTRKEGEVAVAAEAEATPEMQEVPEVQEERAEQEHRLLSIVCQYPQEQQHQLQWLLQEVKLSYHGTHNDTKIWNLLCWRLRIRFS